MASGCFQSNKRSPATGILFFKIVLKPSLEDGILKIPKKFTRKYGGALSNPVFLRPPDGTEWKVYWTKNGEEGVVLFEKGWKEFATHYSVDHGHLLLFKYMEDACHFEVHIFDMTCLQIDYPFHDLTPATDDDSVEILDEIPSPCRGQKKRLGSTISAPSTSGNASKKTSRSISPCPATSEAFKEAKKFDSKNPFFMVDLKQGHLAGSREGFAPSISIVFFRKCFKTNKPNVMIRFGTKLWPAKFIYYPLKSRSIISAGWPLFARENKLKAGDVCVFELVDRKNAVLDVHIFRGRSS